MYTKNTLFCSKKEDEESIRAAHAKKKTKKTALKKKTKVKRKGKVKQPEKSNSESDENDLIDAALVKPNKKKGARKTHGEHLLIL